MSGNEVSGKIRTLSGVQRCSSGEQVDLFCNPCGDDDHDIPADGFCIDCQEYMCRDCIQYHKKFKATKKHTIQDKDSMPKDVNQVHPDQQLVGDMCTEICSKHPGKIIEYFCEAHETLTCSVCATLEHITCGVDYIPEISNGITDSEEYKQLVEDIINQQEIFEDIKLSSKEIIKEVESTCQEHTVIITQLGEYVINHIRSLVQKGIIEKGVIIKDMLDELHQLQEKCKLIHKERISMEKDLESGKKSDCQSFLLMQRLKLKLKKEEPIDQTIPDLKSLFVNLFENSYIKHLTSMKSAVTTQIKKIEFTRCEDINISEQEYEEESYIPCLKVVSNSKVVLADNTSGNKLLKLVNTEEESVFEMELDSEPYGLSEVCEGQLVVTLPNKAEIQFVNVTDILSLCHVISTDDDCKGIAAAKDKLIVSFTSEPSYVKILDLEGKELQKIITGPTGEQLFSDPYFIEVNVENNVFYVSDLGKKKITCFSLEGQVMAIYQNYPLEKFYGIAIDENKYVIACGETGIHHLTAECVQIQTFVNYPLANDVSYCIPYDKSKKKIYWVENGIHLVSYQLG